MSNFDRIRQKKAIREAEGYLDLSIGFSDRCPLALELQERLARRALQALHGIVLDAVATEGTPPSSGRQAHVLYLTGQAYRAMHRYRDAVPFLEDAAELDSENILIWLALAWCYKRVDRLDLAIQALEHGLSIDENEAILHYNLACYWSLAGNAKLAIRFLGQSFDIEPAYRQLVAEETDFNPIRDLPDFQALISVAV